MIAVDISRLAARNLREAKLRTALTTTGVAIGVGALTCMVSFGVGIQEQLFGQFLKSGLFDTITVTSARLGVGPGMRGQPERAGMLASLGALWSHGANIDWGALYPDAGAPVALPPYPLRRQRYWIRAGQTAPSVGRRARPAGERPLVGARVPSPLRPVQFEALWCEESLPFVSDHRIHGTAVVPATAYLEAGRR